MIILKLTNYPNSRPHYVNMSLVTDFVLREDNTHTRLYFGYQPSHDDYAYLAVKETPEEIMELINKQLYMRPKVHENITYNPLQRESIKHIEKDCK